MRAVEEFADGYILGSINMPLPTFQPAGHHRLAAYADAQRVGLGRAQPLFVGREAARRGGQS